MKSLLLPKIKAGLIYLVCVFLLLPVIGWGGTYYVNTAGSNTADGSQAAPWRDPQFASEKAAAGDTIYITAPATAPWRGFFMPTVPGTDTDTRVTFAGTSPTNKAYFLSSWDVTDANDLGNLFVNPGFEGWVTTSNVYGWAESDANVAQSATAHGGVSSVSLTNASYPNISQQLYLPASSDMTISFWYQCVASVTYPPVVTVKDVGPNVNLNTAGEWGSGYTLTTPCEATGTWYQYSQSFATNSTATAKYKLIFQQSAGTKGVLIDDVSLTFNNAVTWAVHDGDTYKLENVIPIAEPATISALSKSTKTAWTAQGVAALVPVWRAASLVACVATANTWWWESGVLYYHLADGEAIADLHLEFGRYNTNAAGTSYSAGAYINQNYITVSNIGVYNAYGNGITSAATGYIGNHIDLKLNGSLQFEAISGTATLNDPSATWGQNDGIDVSGGAVLIVNRGVAAYNYDEGFESYNKGKMTLNDCLSYNNGQNADGGSGNFSLLDADSELTIFNGTSYGGGIGIEAARGTGTGANPILTVKNTIAWGATGGGGDVKSSADVTITADHNLYGTSGGSWDALGGEGTGTITGTDPLFRSATDYRLRAGSPAINAGTDVGLTTDYLGKPIRGLPDIGAYEFYGATGGMLMGLGVGF